MSSHISWTNETWNPVLGCTRVSSGCLHCFAIRDAHRMAHHPNPKMAAANGGLTAKHENGQLDWTGVVRLLPERLTLPLRWRDSRRIFVNSQSDLFHEALTDEQIAQVFAVMALAPQHTFQVLTKRPDRMCAWIGSGLDATRTLARLRIEHATIPGKVRGADAAIRALLSPLTARFGKSWASSTEVAEALVPWPLPNVWLGTSVEDQARADERILHLLRTPAAVRFISAEPLLGPVDLRAYLSCCPSCGYPRRDRMADRCGYCAPLGSWGLSWCIIGGESGGGARPMEIEWARGLVSQCDAAGTVPFFKQAGSVLAKELGYTGKGDHAGEFTEPWMRQEWPTTEGAIYE